MNRNTSILAVVVVVALLALGFGGYRLLEEFGIHLSNPGYFSKKEIDKVWISRIEDNCIRASKFMCEILSITMKKQGNEMREFITKKKFTDCAIVKMSEQNCIEPIGGKSDFFSIECQKDYTTNPSSLCFWFQRYFNVTTQNIENVKENSHLKRYNCIHPKEKNEVEADSVCIRKTAFENDDLSGYPNLTFVNKYLAENLKDYNLLSKDIAKQIKVVPEGLSVYTKYGVKVESSIDEDVIVLPSKLNVTYELLSFMKSSETFGYFICNALGIKKLNEEEIKQISRAKPTTHCFHEEKTFLYSKNQKIWAVGPDFASTRNYAEISAYDLSFAFKNQNFLFVKNKIMLPETWASLTENIHIKKKGDRVVHVTEKDFESILSSESTKTFLEKHGSLIIVGETASKLLENFDYYEMENIFLFFYGNVWKNIDEKTLSNVFWIRFFVLIGKLEEGKILSIEKIHNLTCEELKSIPNRALTVECSYTGAFVLSMPKKESSIANQPKKPQ